MALHQDTTSDQVMCQTQSYAYDRELPYTGVGSGRNKLIMHLEGGGWCYNEDDCVERSRTALGSSKNWPPTAIFNGFLSDNPFTNPLFFEWTLVYLKYCDGASFAGNV